MKKTQKHGKKKDKTTKKNKNKQQQKRDTTKMLTASQVKDMFLLSEQDLRNVPCTQRPNPKSARFAPMRLFPTKLVVQRALQVHGSPRNFVYTALANKRKTVVSKTTTKEAMEAVPVAADMAAISSTKTADLQQQLDVPMYTLVGQEESHATLQRFHFLMQFTVYPLLRDDKLALQIWISRFAEVQTALQFQHLPECLRPEVEALFHQITKASQGIMANRQKLLPDASILWNAQKLEQQDEISRQRARVFIDQGIPNPNECRLLEELLQHPIPALADFTYLFLYEWTPSTLVGQGDAVLADGRGRMVVLEAKAKPGSNTHVRRQSRYYAARLREEYPDAADVAEAILTNDGFAWIREPRIVDEKLSLLPLSVRVDAAAAAAEQQQQEEVASLSVAEQGATAEEKDNSVTYRYLAPSRIDQLEAMVVDRELKPLLRFYNLKLSGPKADLVERIFQHEHRQGVAGGF